MRTALATGLSCASHPFPSSTSPDRQLVLRYAAESSRTTHGAPECLDACRLLADILLRAFQGADKETTLFSTEPVLLESRSIRAIAQGNYRDLGVENIRGDAYVVRSLQAALWSFLHSESFSEAVLTAANLGDDADTTAAICGQIAGAYFGEEGIPGKWLEILTMGKRIGTLAVQLRESRQASLAAEP